MGSGLRAFLVESEPADVASQMAFDEALLDAARPDTLYLRLYRWPGEPPYGATFGYSQTFREALEAVRSRRGEEAASPLPVRGAPALVRRLTGGGVVHHDGDLTFSLVFPWPRTSAPSLIYKNVHLGVHLGLKARGIPSRLWSAPRRGPAASIRLECFSAAETADLVAEDGTKVLGGALRRRRGTGLYQGSLRPERLGLPEERLREAVVDGVGLQWSALFAPARPAEQALEEARRLRRERYGSDEWNKRR